MSGRDTSKATDGNKTLRSQSAQSQGSNTGSAGRGPGGKGQGPPIPGNGGGAGPLDAGNVRSAEGPLRPPVFSTTGVNNLHGGDEPRILFGSAIGTDGSVNTAPSPQQPERPSVDRPTTAGRNGQGGRGSNKQSQGRRQISSAAPRLAGDVPKINFGHGIPPIHQAPPQMMNPMGFNPAYPSHPSGYNQQYGYPGQMYTGYAPQGGYQPYMQSPAPSAYTRQQRGGPPQGSFPQHRGQGYQGGQGGGSRSNPPANGKPEKPAPTPPSAPRRAPLKLQNPQTGEEIVIGGSKAKPSEPEPAGPSMQKQPSSGGPTAKPEQPPVNGAPPSVPAAPKRVLTIAPPPSGGPSKASPVKEKKPPPPPPHEKDASNESSGAKQTAEAEADAEAKRKQEAEAEAKRAEEAAQKQAREAAEKEAAAAEKVAAEKKAAEAREAAERERKSAEERAALQKAEAEKKAAAEREAAQKAEAERKAAAEKAKKEAEEATEREEAARKLAAEEKAQAKAREEEAAKEAQKREKEAAAKKEAEAAAAAKKDEAAPGDEESASAAARPKKGKKALQDAIRRKDEETRAEVRGDADLSAYKSPAQRAAAAAPPAPPTPPPVASPVKAAPQEAAEEPSWEEEEEKKAAAPRKDEQESKKKWKPTHVYTADFLRSFNQNHIAKDNGLMVRTWPGLQLIEVPEVMRGQEGHGRGGFRGGPPGPTGGPVSGRPGPRDLPAREEQNWNRGRPLQPPAPPGGFNGPPGALPSGPMGGMGGRGGGRGGPHGGFPTDNDRWLRSNPLPPVPQAPKLPQLHKTANRFERGMLISENPVEEAKQKNIKSLLNKITPEKYTVIRDKLLASGIDSPLSLLGLIDQVFDKALTEPTFCEIYATLCHDLNRSLPQFDPEPDAEDQKKITFRRSLVNKCQEEFMAGTEAMEAVKQREVADAEKGDGATPEAAELEEGEISQEDKLAKRRKELADAQNERKGRMRALGNIQFVGQLYKQAMLTEKIMHECIKTLLEDIETPRTEDVECLCKLMSTVGSQLENSTKYVKAHMDAYFERMDKMSKLPNLESRLKFMIRDVADLRKNRWQERRKTEGPKTIEEIHRDARMEAQQAARLPEPRGPRMSGGGPRGGGFGQPPMGSRPPMHLQKRHEDRLEEKPRPMTRTPSQEGPLAPGGLGGSFRPGGSLGSRGSSPAPSREPAASTSEATPAAPAESQTAAKAEAKPSGADREAGMSEEESAKRAGTILNDFVVSKDTDEARTAIKGELLGRGGSGAVALHTWFTKSFEKKESERPACKEFLLFVAESKLLSEADTRDGLSNLLEELSDVAVDVPFAPKLVAEFLGALLAAGGLRLEELGKLLLTAGRGEDADAEADTDLVDSGIALKVLAQAIKEYAAKAGAEKPLREWKASSLDAKKFVPEFARDDALKELEKEGLADYA